MPRQIRAPHSHPCDPWRWSAPIGAAVVLVAVWGTSLSATFVTHTTIGTLITMALVGIAGAVFASLLSIRRQIARDRMAGEAFLNKFFAPRAFNRQTIERALETQANVSVMRRCAAWIEATRGRSANSGVHGELDRDRQDAASVTAFARFGIWSLPILGFIGTVFGISEAIGSLSVALDGIGDPTATAAALKEHLPEVTKHLGTAFDTTLWGLVFCLPATFALFRIERALERHISALDERWAVDILPVLVMGPASQNVDASSQPLACELRELAAHIESLRLTVHEYQVGLARTYEGTA